MSAKVSIKDGTGTDKEAKVDKTGPSNENSVWTHVAGISPQLTIPVVESPVSGSEIFEDTVKNGGSDDLTVDGSATPVEFTIDADIDKDIIINQLIMAGEDGSVKLTNFFSLNSPLTNGIIIEFKSDDVISTLRLIKTTGGLLAFSTGAQDVYTESGSASVLSFRDMDPPIIIRKQGFHESGVDDYVKVIIQDNITNVDDLIFSARGFKIESGEF